MTIKEWWEWCWKIPADRGKAWWRAHLPAHFGHGIFFFAWWLLVLISPPLLGAVLAGTFFVILWEFWQREVWASMPLWTNLWDIVFGVVGILLVGGIILWAI